MAGGKKKSRSGGEQGDHDNGGQKTDSRAALLKKLKRGGSVEKVCFVVFGWFHYVSFYQYFEVLTIS